MLTILDDKKDACDDDYLGKLLAMRLKMQNVQKSFLEKDPNQLQVLLRL